MHECVGLEEKEIFEDEENEKLMFINAPRTTAGLTSPHRASRLGFSILYHCTVQNRYLEEPC